MAATPRCAGHVRPRQVDEAHDASRRLRARRVISTAAGSRVVGVPGHPSRRAIRRATSRKRKVSAVTPLQDRPRPRARRAARRRCPLQERRSIASVAQAVGDALRRGERVLLERAARAAETRGPASECRRFDERGERHEAACRRCPAPRARRSRRRGRARCGRRRARRRATCAIRARAHARLSSIASRPR